jgi:hypothetical protein
METESMNLKQQIRKQDERNRKRREKYGMTHSKTCSTVTWCNCGTEPHDKFCCFFYPDNRTCNCGAQARIDAKKKERGDEKLDALIELKTQRAKKRV